MVLQQIGQTYHCVGENLYSMAKGYSIVVKTGASVVSNVADATLSVAQSTIDTLVSPLHFAKQSAKSLFGISNFQQGWDSVHSQSQTIIDPQNPQKVIAVIPDQRTFSQRIGEMFGHWMAGSAKMYATTTGVSAYVAGNACNLMQVHSQNQLINASQMFASSFNTIATFGISAAIQGARAVASAAGPVLQAVVAHPITTAKIGAWTGCMGASLYLACSEGVQAVDAKTVSAKLGHTALAVAGIAGMCLTPMVIN